MGKPRGPYKKGITKGIIPKTKIMREAEESHARFVEMLTNEQEKRRQHTEELEMMLSVHKVQRWNEEYLKAKLRWGLAEPWMMPAMTQLCKYLVSVQESGGMHALCRAYHFGYKSPFTVAEIKMARRTAVMRKSLPHHALRPLYPNTVAEDKAIESYWEEYHSLGLS